MGFYIFLVLMFFPVMTVCSELCNLVQLRSCMDSLKSFYLDEPAYRTTKIELEEICTQLQANVLCVDKHLKPCFSCAQRNDSKNYHFATAKQFVTDLCVAGPIQEAYLKYAPCYQNVSLPHECVIKYLMRLDYKVLQRYCCTYNAYNLCKYNLVAKECGQDASDLLQQLVDKAPSSTLIRRCADYTYANGACT